MKEKLKVHWIVRLFDGSNLHVKTGDYVNKGYRLLSIATKEVRSPVNALVVKISEEKIVLEFEAVEFKGDGVVDGKVWGESDFEIVNEINKINFEYNGKVVLTEEISQSFLTKAQVLGVVAIITVKNDFNFAKINTSLPILVLDKTEWSKLKEYGGKNRQLLINTKLERLLIVIE